MNRIPSPREAWQALRSGGGLTAQSLAVFLFKVAGAGLQFVFYFVLARTLGTEGFGLYDLVLTLVMFLGTLVLWGGSKSIMQYAGRLKARARQEEVGGVFLQLVGLILGFSLPLGLALWFTGDWLAVHAFGEPQLGFHLKRLGLAIPFFALFFLNLDMLRATDRLRWSEFLRNLPKPVLAIAITLLLFTTDRLAGEGVLWLVVSVHVVLAALTAVPVAFGARGRHTWRSTVPMGDLVTSGWSLMLTMIIVLLLGTIDRVMITGFLDLEDNGLYAAAAKLILPIDFVLTAVNQVIATRIADHYFAGQRSALQTLLHRSTRLIVLASLPIMVGIAALGAFFLGLLGPEFEAARWVLYILIVGRLVNVFCGPVGNFFTMTGHQGEFRNFLFLAVVLNIGLNALLIPRMGVEGVALATAVSLITWNVLGALYVKRRLGFRVFFWPFGAPVDDD